MKYKRLAEYLLGAALILPICDSSCEKKPEKVKPAAKAHAVKPIHFIPSILEVV